MSFSVDITNVEALDNNSVGGPKAQKDVHILTILQRQLKPADLLAQLIAVYSYISTFYLLRGRTY